MKIHLGRLIDHVHIVVRDLEKSREFYKTILNSIGRELTIDGKKAFGSDELYVTQTEDGLISRIHLAFQVPDKETVAKFYQAALKAGGRDNGAPGERPYHPGYYAGFVFDPDGNNLEAVFHGSAERSADSVVIDANL